MPNGVHTTNDDGKSAIATLAENTATLETLNLAKGGTATAAESRATDSSGNTARGVAIQYTGILLAGQLARHSVDSWPLADGR